MASFFGGEKEIGRMLTVISNALPRMKLLSEKAL